MLLLFVNKYLYPLIYIYIDLELMNLMNRGI